VRWSLRRLLIIPLLGCLTWLSAEEAVASPSLSSSDSGAAAWHVVQWFPRYTDLTAIAAVSRTDAWAVGGAGKASRPAVFHWGGVAWRRAAVRGLGKNFSLEDVEATSGSNVWIFGETPRPSRVVLRYDGSTWVRIPAPADNLDPSDVVVLGPDDAWWAQPDSQASTMWHWNGSFWAAVTVPGYVTGLDGEGHQFWLATQEHGLAPGRTSVLRWTGSGWQDMGLPDTRKLWWPQVAVSAGGQAWVEDIPAHGASWVSHWTGRRWQKIKVPATADGRPVSITNVMTYDGHDGVWFQGTAHWTGVRWTVPALGPYPLSVLAMQAPVAPIPDTRGTWGIGFIDTSRTVHHNWRYFLAVEGAKP
jgi:hypothetical protein